MITSAYKDSPDLMSISFLYIISCWDAKWKRSTVPLASGKVAEGIQENKQIKFEGPGISVLKRRKDWKHSPFTTRASLSQRISCVTTVKIQRKGTVCSLFSELPILLFLSVLYFHSHCYTCLARSPHTICLNKKSGKRALATRTQWMEARFTDWPGFSVISFPHRVGCHWEF